MASFIPSLLLYSLDGSFAARNISLPRNLRVDIGRHVEGETNTTPSQSNGFFEAGVVSRRHAQVWEDNGKIFLLDLDSTQGTCINGESIGPDAEADDIELEASPHELKNNDVINFGRDIIDDSQTLLHKKVSVRVVCVLSERDALAAAEAEQRNTTTLIDLTNTSTLGKRRNRDLEDQTTAFKRARKLARGGIFPVESFSNSPNESREFMFSPGLSAESSFTSVEDMSDDDVAPLHEEATTGAVGEFHLLDDSAEDSGGRSEDHEIRTAPLLARGAFIAAKFDEQSTQYGVLGRCISIHSKAGHEVPDDTRLYVNTNAPFSAVICGLQGSGKSHTMSVLLENMFIPNYEDIGALEKPLSGLVLHFGQGGPSSRPSEAAWIGTSALKGVSPPKIRVFVSHSSLKTMRAVYAPLGKNVTIEPLYFKEEELDAESFLSMMAVGSSESAPLYVQIILSILRELGENFTYTAFKKTLEERKKTFNPQQLVGLEQRMSLLNAFMNDEWAASNLRRPRFSAGQLTIIDLSDPFIDSSSACGLFEIVIRLFVRAEVETGKVLVVDEAHKYLSTSRGASGLTKSLLTLTREQRHLAMRVLISTQEPTVIPPVLLDLCTVSILHRFSSPSWWEHLAHHVSADFSGENAFDKVVKLKTGEAIVLAPSGFGIFKEHTVNRAGELVIKKSMGQFGRRYLVMKTRKRITSDGGASILVLD